MTQSNEEFGLPPVAEAKQEIVSAAERVARLREKAEAQAAAEFDEDAIYARLLTEARAKHLSLLSGDEVELPTDTRGFPEDYDRINIFKGSNKQDLSYVPLSLNGLCIKVPRGVDVILPHAFVVDCLDQCIEDVTTPAIDARGNLAGIEIRPAHRFPYQNKGKATTAEYKAFQEQQLEQAARQLARVA